MSLLQLHRCQTVAEGSWGHLVTIAGHQVVRRRREFASRTTTATQMGTGMPGPGNQWETGEPPAAHPQLPAGLEFQPMNNHTLFSPPLESIWFLIQPRTGRSVSAFRLPQR